jgi:hypothetical protein
MPAHRVLRRLTAAGATLGAVVAVLAVPARDPRVEAAPAHAASFQWNRDAYWKGLEIAFAEQSVQGCAAADSLVYARIVTLDATVAALASASHPPDAPGFDSLELAYFDLGARIAACGSDVRAYAELQSRIRDAVKAQSREWDMNAQAARARVYRALYGSRAALEEVMLHHPGGAGDLLAGSGGSSATPSVVIEGVRIHSGDMLVSRGGYPTSALIARGSDFPGNFSHVALVHVDASSGAASTIEAHIERGVAISTAVEYLAGKKRRILVLRPRADLPALVANPMLPHEAASRMLARARSERIPYDFTMDYADASRLFCSEVASAAYRELGLTLWTGLSTISAPGLRRWLASFGVTQFETQEPSDLEYDPQLVVVAEWRDTAALAADHIDNAVIDAMLEGAERGDALEYNWIRLPLARVAKGSSWTLNRFGRTGPIPEGMSATAALRNAAFSARQRELAAGVTGRAAEWAEEHGYPPPYWVLVGLARGELSGIGNRE